MNSIQNLFGIIALTITSILVSASIGLFLVSLISLTGLIQLNIVNVSIATVIILIVK